MQFYRELTYYAAWDGLAPNLGKADRLILPECHQGSDIRIFYLGCLLPYPKGKSKVGCEILCAVFSRESFAERAGSQFCECRGIRGCRAPNGECIHDGCCTETRMCDPTRL